jgi:hypothetical protein
LIVDTVKEEAVKEEEEAAVKEEEKRYGGVRPQRGRAGGDRRDYCRTA